MSISYECFKNDFKTLETKLIELPYVRSCSLVKLKTIKCGKWPIIQIHILCNNEPYILGKFSHFSVYIWPDGTIESINRKDIQNVIKSWVDSLKNTTYTNARMDPDVQNILNQIAAVKEKIERWKQVNSQSDPGAVMELREYERSLVKWQKLLETISSYNFS